MKMKLLSVVLLIAFFASCSNQEMQKELLETKLELKETQALLAEAKSDSDENYPLVHVVYFKLKPDADKAKLLEAINKLEEIEVLHELEVGTFEDLEDERALSDFQIVMSMAFANEADYKSYQAHDTHLALKALAKEMLAGPPATYDYMR